MAAAIFSAPTKAAAFTSARRPGGRGRDAFHRVSKAGRDGFHPVRFFSRDQGRSGIGPYQLSQVPPPLLCPPFPSWPIQIFDLYVLKGSPPGQVAKTLGISTARVYLTKHRVAGLVKKVARRLEKAAEQTLKGPA